VTFVQEVVYKFCHTKMGEGALHFPLYERKSCPILHFRNGYVKYVNTNTCT
jgi:hypothetical protein